MITAAGATEPAADLADAADTLFRDLSPAARPMTLQELELEYGYTFTSVADLWSEIEVAPSWWQLNTIRSKVQEFLDVDPPVLSLVDGDALLRAINSRLNSPPIGSADDWLRLSDSEQRAVRMLLDRIEQGHKALSLSPDQHAAIVQQEIDRMTRAGLPEAMTAKIIDLLNQSMHCEVPIDATTDAEPMPGRKGRDHSGPFGADSPAGAKQDVAAASHGRLAPWANDIRCFPRCLVRSALLRPTKSSPINLRRVIPIPSLGGILMSGRGHTLSQADLDVCLAALHLARRKPLGQRVEVTLAALIQAAGRTDGERTRAGVTASLRRISRFRFSVEVKKPAQEFRGTLLENVSVHRRRRDGRYCVSYVVPPGLLELFLAGRARISFEQRKALAGHPLAGWLQMFIESHRGVHRISVTRYHELTGLRCSIDEFRRLLKIALDKLVAVGVITSGTIEDDKVCVTRVKKDGPKQG